MNVVYYVDRPSPARTQCDFSSKSSFQDVAAVEAQYAQLIRDSAVGYAPAGPSLVSGRPTGVTSLRAPVLPVVQPPLWPANLHATFNNTTQIQYLVRLFDCKFILETCDMIGRSI